MTERQPVDPADAFTAPGRINLADAHLSVAATPVAQTPGRVEP